MKQAIRTFLAVAFLTLVIWVWADLEQQTDETFFVPVEVQVPAGFEVAKVSPDRLKVKVRGPSAEIRGLMETGPGKPNRRVCRLLLTDPGKLAPGTVRVRAVEGFRHWDENRVVPLAVLTLDDKPLEDVTVEVEHLVQVRVPVEVRVVGAVVKAAASQPAEVTATVSESRFQALAPAKRKAVAVVKVSALPPDLQIREKVPLELGLGGAEGVRAAFDPRIVEVTATIESASATKTLAQVPVAIAAPPDVLRTYDVVFQDESVLLVDLRVEGPRELVEPLTPGQVGLWLALTAADKPVEEGPWIGRVPQASGLPPGVRLAEPPPTINFNLKRRESPRAP
jgi:hypothetical protein